MLFVIIQKSTLRRLSDCLFFKVQEVHQLYH
jgi:hypothetical protein